MSSYFHQRVNEDEEESVYNLIEQPVEIREKGEMYRSAYPGTTPPSYSTFGLKNTTKPGIANAGGNYHDLDMHGGQYKIKKGNATMGKSVKKDVRPDSFMKKTQGQYTEVLRTMSSQRTQKFERTLPEGVSKRAPIPKKDEKPIMGLISKKNYVVSNAVDNILSAPKKVKQPEALWTQKAEFGKVPDYLVKIKQEIQDEYEYINQLQQQTQTSGKSMRRLTEEEKESLIDGLRQKWNALHEKYQSFSFAMPSDKVHIQRKEAVEEQMDQIEKSIIKLSKQHIYVYDDEDVDYN